MLANYSDQQLIRFATVLAVSVNFVLAVLKLAIGIVIGSTALLADGIDSFLDIITSIFAYIGVRVANKPPDTSHPYGHEKMEIFFSLGIFVLITYSSIQIFVTAINQLLTQQEFIFNISGLIVAIFSVGLKILISFVILHVGTRVHSPALIANAKNFRTDVFSSVLVGVSMIFACFQIGILDSVMAIVICILIGYTGLTIFFEGWNILVDKAPPEEVLIQLHSLAMEEPGIKEVHLIRARAIQGRIMGDLHILVEPSLTVLEGHKISEKVTFRLKTELNASMIVHLEPFIEEERLQELIKDGSE
ncbi:MAG: cation transporter [Candidatus Heimdallarchaeota archaeon]|nr:cation transporter [Candidatus Heimdallarchaeota archaeon]